MKFYTSDTFSGTFIDEVSTVEEGLALIKKYEDQDKATGIYEEGFYCVVDENHCTVS